MFIIQIMYNFEHERNNRQKMTKKDYRNRIRVVLADKQMTNRWLAEKMGVTEMTVSRWKTNKIQPSMPQFLEIARLLQVDIKDLLEVNNDARVLVQ